MTGKIQLEIRSSHEAPEQEAQHMTSAAEGTCFVKGEKYHILYEECQPGGDDVIKNHIILSPDQMELRQKGAIRSKMIFAGDKTHETVYFTPYGQIPIVIHTNSISVRMPQEDASEKKICIAIDYRMESGGSQVTACKMEIVVRGGL